MITANSCPCSDSDNKMEMYESLDAEESDIVTGGPTVPPRDPVIPPRDKPHSMKDRPLSSPESSPSPLPTPQGDTPPSLPRRSWHSDREGTDHSQPPKEKFSVRGSFPVRVTIVETA